ncbi:hypothetical protein ZEAMMB73_Zm00001d011395 [Zea mays]|uniref:Uncharacterized protein n=1 Tax=Zea mays TaxID=4577 RepID=A0A1D6FZS2_MAIZE|nr:hypothetical protein ZEAMMB73_Zm00001d011395 [Zea mays]
MSAQICLARHPVVFLPETPWPASSPRSSSSRRCRLPGPLPACFHAFASVCSVSVLLSHPFLQNFSFSRLDLPEWAQERLHFLYESRLAVGKSSEGFQALQQSTPGPASRPLLHRRVRLIVPRYYLIPVSTFIVPHLRVQIS